MTKAFRSSQDSSDSSDDGEEVREIAPLTARSSAYPHEMEEALAALGLKPDSRLVMVNNDPSETAPHHWSPALRNERLDVPEWWNW